jgi:hypothetical protein
MVPVDVIRPRLAYDNTNTELGPDLALLCLPSEYRGDIHARKTALNVQKLTDLKYPEFFRGLYAVSGLIGEFSIVDVHPRDKRVHAEIHTRCLFLLPEKEFESGDYDYLEFEATVSLKNAPFSFGGLSGAGVWQIDLSRNAEGQIVRTRAPMLRGVAFWESSVNNQIRTIRAHGHKAWLRGGLFPN